MIIRWDFTAISNISHCFYENNTPDRFRFTSSRSQALLKILQISQENICWSLFLITMQASRLEACNLFQKRLHGDLHGDSNTGVFLLNLQNLQEHLFVQNNPGGCFSRLILKIVYNILYSVFCNFRNWVYKEPVLNFWNCFG